MKSLYGVSGRSRARVKPENSFSVGLEWAVAANRELLSRNGLNLTAGQGNGAQLQQIANPWKGIPNFGILQPSASHYGPATVRRRINDMNGGPILGHTPGWSIVWGMYIAALANGYILGVMINDSSAMNTSTQSGNWRLWTQSNGSLNLEMVYYNNPISWAATNVSVGAGYYKTGFHTYGISRVSATQFDFYCDGDYVTTGSSADGGFGGPLLYMGATSAEASLGFHCHGAVHANNTYSLGNTMVFAFGWSRSFDRSMMQRLTYDPGVILGATARHGAASVGAVHSMEASVSTATTVGATLRKRARMTRGISAAATVSATPQARYRMQAAVSAQASITNALLTDAAVTQAIAAEVAAAASVSATMRVRRHVAASVGTITTVAALLGKRQRLNAFVFTQTTTSATMGRKHRLNAAISAAATTSATMRRKFLMQGATEATAEVGGTIRVRRRLDLEVNTSTTVTAQVVGADVLEPVIGNVRKVYLTTYVKKRNRMDRLEISSITEEYIDVVFVSKNNVDTFPVKMALSAIGEEPTEWTDGEWVDDENYHRGTKWFNTARCLAGGDGLNIDTPGEFQLWIKVEGPGDTPVKKAGTVAVS